jgi:hypothetical protein
MNNKTLVAFLVIVLVVLAGIGVGKYAENMKLKQEAASLESQQDEMIMDESTTDEATPGQEVGFWDNFGPAGATVLDEGEPVYVTLPNGKSMMSCQVHIGLLPLPTTVLAPGAAVTARFEITGCPANDVVLNTAGINLVYVAPNYNFRFDFTSLKDVNTSQTVALGGASNVFYYEYNTSGNIVIPAGTTHVFEVSGMMEGVPVPGNAFVTQLATLQLTVPTLGNAPAVVAPALPLPGQSMSL